MSDFKNETDRLLKTTTLKRKQGHKPMQIGPTNRSYTDFYEMFLKIGYKDLLFTDIEENILFSKVLFNQYSILHTSLVHSVFFYKENNIIRVEFSDEKVTLLQAYISAIYTSLGKAISIINENKKEYKKIIGIRNWNFLKKVSETRSKIFIHNYNPIGFKIQIKLVFETALNTTGDLVVSISTNNNNEYKEKQLFINLVEDYLKVEEIFWNLLYGERGIRTPG